MWNINNEEVFDNAKGEENEEGTLVFEIYFNYPCAAWIYGKCFGICYQYLFYKTLTLKLLKCCNQMVVKKIQV